MIALAPFLALLTLMLVGCEDAPGPSREEQEGHDAHEKSAHEKSAHEKSAHGDHQAPGVVHIAQEAVTRAGIVVEVVQSAPAVGGIQVPAEVQTEPDRLAHVSSVVSGQIDRVSVAVGDHVKAGQRLAVIRSVALGEARAGVARARADMEVAESNFRRQQELKREGIGAERHFLEAQAALRRAQAERSAAQRALEVYGHGGQGSEITIRSPIAGRVIARHATVGEVVSPGAVLFEITDIEQVWVVGRVYQQHAGQVREGASAFLTLQALPDRTFTGRLDYVAPSLDERTRTLPVRLTLPNPEGVLKPGLFGTLSITASEQDATTVPAIAERALQRLEDSTVVFVPGDEPGEFRAVEVTPGPRVGALVRIERGLQPGQRYVADGAFVLKSELRRGELGEGHAH